MAKSVSEVAKVVARGEVGLFASPESSLAEGLSNFLIPSLPPLSSGSSNTFCRKLEDALGV